MLHRKEFLLGAVDEASDFPFEILPGQRILDSILQREEESQIIKHRGLGFGSGRSHDSIF